MRRIRVIPTLLLRRGGLVKGQQFKNHKYVGDPINTVKIFNEKCVDELIFLDITATAENRDPNYEILRDIASEAFMPFGYGGGVNKLDHVKSLLDLGIEKVIVNSALHNVPDFVRDACNYAGSQSIVGSIDFKTNLFGATSAYINSGTTKVSTKILDFARKAEDLGIGELILTNIDREGSRDGFKTELVAKIADALSIPLVISGGAGKVEDFENAIQVGKASAIAAGEMFTFIGKHRAVLINYPAEDELNSFYEKMTR